MQRKPSRLVDTKALKSSVLNSVNGLVRRFLHYSQNVESCEVSGLSFDNLDVSSFQDSDPMHTLIDQNSGDESMGARRVCTISFWSAHGITCESIEASKWDPRWTV